MENENKKKYKENPADTAAGKWLDEQKELAPKRRIVDRALLISLTVIIAVFGVLTDGFLGRGFAVGSGGVAVKSAL